MTNDIGPATKYRHARGFLSGIQALWITVFAGMTIAIFSHRRNSQPTLPTKRDDPGTSTGVVAFFGNRVGLAKKGR
jgi:hypothetical protein